MSNLAVWPENQHWYFDNIEVVTAIATQSCRSLLSMNSKFISLGALALCSSMAHLTDELGEHHIEVVQDDSLHRSSCSPNMCNYNLFFNHSPIDILLRPEGQFQFAMLIRAHSKVCAVIVVIAIEQVFSERSMCPGHVGRPIMYLYIHTYEKSPHESLW